jgi:hypothetical protein
MSDDKGHFDEAAARRALARGLLRMALRHLRHMRMTSSRPRKRRLVKDARAVKSLMAQARAAGLVPPERRRGDR